MPCRRRSPLVDDHYDLDALLAAIGPRTKLVYIATPNNPTGTMTTREQLDAYFERVPEHVLTVLDQAYFEYIDRPDYPDAIEEYLAKAGRRVLVLRTFSKIYGLAGLRVGYGVGTEDVIQAIGKTRRAFDVNTQAQVAALASIDDAAELERAAAAHAEGRDDARAGAPRARPRAGRPGRRELPLRRGRRRRPSLFEALLRQGAIVRPMAAFGAPGALRITVGTPDENAFFAEALASVRGRRRPRRRLSWRRRGRPGARLPYAHHDEKRLGPRCGRERQRPARATARRALADHDLPPAGAAPALALGDLPDGPRLGRRRPARRDRLGRRRRYLWFHESVAGVVASTPDVKVAAKRLDVALPGQPTTALVDRLRPARRRGQGAQSRSDTVMLVRADPETKSISMLSFPRDLFVEIHCPGKPPFGARINDAYADCGTKGTLETVRKLTGLPVNYLITVNFRGFRQLVDAIGGVWIDVDRRYFNDRGGDFGYATINLLPGYQKLGGYQALDFVRYRHTDSDLYRVARQQLFVRAFKDQIKANTGPLKLPKVIKTITSNVEVGVGGNSELDGETVLEYALFAYSLPPGHFFQSKIEGLEETSGLRHPRARGEHPEGGAGVLAPGRRVAEEGDRGGAEREAEGEGRRRRRRRARRRSPS